MPPQSRGDSTDPVRNESSMPLPPTLRPFLETLPSPTTLIPDQRTPTGPRMTTPERDMATPTPSPENRRGTPTFELGGEDKDEIEDDEAYPLQGNEAAVGEPDPDDNDDVVEIEVPGVTLDDDDFESHYSRHESSESEEEEEDDLYVGEETMLDEDGGEMEEERQNGVLGPGGSFPSSSGAPGLLSRVRSLPARSPLSQSQAHTQHSEHRSGLHTSQSTTSLPPPPPPPPLYPPFYNRPPTPLPPSPSLTSLLRPPSLLNRSTASTRPTTPDSSDVETPNDTEAAVAHSARRAHPLPPTSPKVPTYEYYGFVLYLASTLTFLIYLLWSYLPSPFLHALGITYYPNRWWSLALPAWIVMLLIFIYVALLSYNVEYLTLPLDSLECMVDDAGNVAVIDDAGRVRKGGSKRLVEEFEERARLELQQTDSARTKGGKSRKHSKAGGGAANRSKEKGKRKSSRTASEHGGLWPQDLPAWDQPGNQSPTPATQTSSQPARASHPYHFPPTYPFVTSDLGPRQLNYGTHPNGNKSSYPNWKLTWNEGTDGVLDVPIGGVCEVLYS